LSQYVLVRSKDNGETWGDAELICSPSDGASQDGGLFYDGKYLYANSFVWKYVPDIVAANLKETGGDEFLHKYLTYMLPGGSYVMRSADKGHSWEGPFSPSPLPGGKEILPGVPLTIHNRGNIVKAADGRLLLVGQALGFRPEFNSSVVVYESLDQGKTWEYFSTAADCGGVSVFEEPRLHVTPSGKYVMLIRCHRDGEDKFARAMLFVAESKDKGKTWTKPRNTGIHAEPSTSFLLDDGRAIVAYGYRLEPFGVRLKVCSPELDDLDTAEEIIVRADAERIGENRFLIGYYINKPSYRGAARIEGTITEIK